MIGDTMETDIMGGVQMGYQTVLTLSGGTRREDLVNFAFRPIISLSRSLNWPIPNAIWLRCSAMPIR